MPRLSLVNLRDLQSLTLQLVTMILTPLNTVPEQDPISSPEMPFIPHVPPKTDVFASPALGYHFSAPILYTAIPTTSFKSARATISVPFSLQSSTRPSNPTLQFDQAGLIFVLPHPSLPFPSLTQPGGKSASQGNPSAHPKWIKAGIEVWEGNAWGSIVAREQWCDWSTFELSPSTICSDARKLRARTAR
jgi:uncharacterized protein